MLEHRTPGSREIALAVLYQVEVDKAYTNLSLDQALKKNPMGSSDRALVTEMVYGTVKHQLTLDFAIEQISGRPTNQLSAWILIALRLGLYQILFLDRVPPHAAVSETVEAVKKRVHQGAVGLVNAVLRKATRGVQLDFGDPTREPVLYLSRKFSHPAWLVASWLQELGFEETEALLRVDNIAPAVHLRVNTLMKTRQDVLDWLGQEGLDAQASPLLAEAIRLGKGSLDKTEVLNRGWAMVQDEGAMLISHAVDPRPGELVWDVCSAPGGKTTHMAEMMNNQGHIDATDIHQHRLRMIDQLAHRLGVKTIHLIDQDARVFAATSTECYDRVLVDAPCSGTGVLRRKVDARWQKTPEQVRQLGQLQIELLQAVAPRVKPGGVLVYSTCSLEKIEDEDVTCHFLATKSGFEPLPLRATAFPKDLLTGDEHDAKLFPHRHGTDGFYVAAFRRR